VYVVEQLFDDQSLGPGWNVCWLNFRGDGADISFVMMTMAAGSQ
jgi:hypothetical protein